MIKQCILLCLFAITIQAQQKPSFSHKAFDLVLQNCVNESGLVDYENLKKKPENLNAYLAQLAQYSPETTPKHFPSQSDSLAYWINAYNAFAIKGVIDAYPVKSVRDIKWFYGFFNRTKYNAGRKKYTLKHIEHEIVRKQFPDPRIHAALNCASMGCPQLPKKAFHAETLNEDLEREMCDFLREARNVTIDRQNEKIYLSNILKEFDSDFTTYYQDTYNVESATILDYLQLYLPQDDTQYLKQHPNLDIEYINYDWRLNDQKFDR